MARPKNRTSAISFRTTPTMKGLLLAAMIQGGFANYTAVIEAAVREYAERRRIKPLTAEEIERIENKE